MDQFLLTQEQKEKTQNPCENCNIMRNELEYDPEFSLPCGFFKSDFLDNYLIREPMVQERMQL
jgi:hypothetical protein